MRQAIGDELGIDMSATADLRRGNVVLPDGDDRWMQRERKITHSGKLYTPKTSREVIRIKALELKERAITPEIQEEISSLRKSIDGVLDDVRDPEMREQAANILARLQKEFIRRYWHRPYSRSPFGICDRNREVLPSQPN